MGSKGIERHVSRAPPPPRPALSLSPHANHPYSLRSPRRYTVVEMMNNRRHPKRQHRRLDDLFPNGQTMMMVSRTKSMPELRALLDEGGAVGEEHPGDAVPVGGGEVGRGGGGGEAGGGGGEAGGGAAAEGDARTASGESSTSTVAQVGHGDAVAAAGVVPAGGGAEEQEAEAPPPAKRLRTDQGGNAGDK